MKLVFPSFTLTKYYNTSTQNYTEQLCDREIKNIYFLIWEGYTMVADAHAIAVNS